MTTSAIITSSESSIRVEFSGDLIYGASVMVIPKRNIQSVTLGEFVNLNIYDAESLSFSVEDSRGVTVKSVNGFGCKDAKSLMEAVTSII